ncbi:MAG: 16S rRNA (cytidine(1402)-2'-O)-methyltransferase [Porphyromonas sp.]|nr:16S rRNA (cytidine(1402)-2'-O)-methyltransferase [Porphyromonas sp.]
MPALVLIPTPIGNLEDITYRAVRILKEVDLILAEDTRTSARLLQEYGISTPITSYHKFNEHKIVDQIANELEQGKQVALISDAGTPGISDPGFLLVKECVARGIKVSCLPGATAFVPALVASGLPSDRFIFEGFLPHKKGRLSRIESLREREVTTIFYESPNRLTKLLEQLRELLGDERDVVVAREISKIYEEYRHGTPSELLEHFTATPPLGEIVVLLGPAAKQAKVHKNKYKESED